MLRLCAIGVIYEPERLENLLADEFAQRRESEEREHVDNNIISIHESHRYLGERGERQGVAKDASLVCPTVQDFVQIFRTLHEVQMKVLQIWEERQEQRE